MTTTIVPVSTDLELGKTIIEKKYAKLWKQHHTKHVWIGMANKRKVQVQSRFATAVTMFAFIIMVLTIILDSVVPVYSGLHHVAAVCNFYLVLLVWSATLPMCNPWQLKTVCVIPIFPYFTGKYKSGIAYMESTVVDISIPPPSFRPVSLLLSRSPLF